MEEKSQARRWILTINNPKETDEQMKEYIEGLEHFKYAIFSREKGHQTGTEHFQMFIIFKISKRFNTIKTYFPTAHIEKAKGSNSQCREYCSKSDTHISGPYEIGVFAEERERTDVKEFMELIRTGASDSILSDLFPSLFLREMNKLDRLRFMQASEKYRYQDRDLEVTYIYGESGVGKTSYVNDLVRGKDCYFLSLYDNSAFTGYVGEDILVMDEFKGRFALQYLNQLLDGSSHVRLRGLNFAGCACFTKVYIVSNFHYRDLYKDEQIENGGQYNGFVRRLNNVIKIEPFGRAIIERETIFEDIPLSEQKLNGKKRRVKQVIEYEKNGCSKIIYDKNRNEQIKLEELSLLQTGELPW